MARICDHVERAKTGSTPKATICIATALGIEWRSVRDPLHSVEACRSVFQWRVLTKGRGAPDTAARGVDGNDCAGFKTLPPPNSRSISQPSRPPAASGRTLVPDRLRPATDRRRSGGSRCCDLPAELRDVRQEAALLGAGDQFGPHVLMRRAHEARPDLHRQAAAGRLAGRRVVVVAEPHAGHELRGVADEPRIAKILAGAGLAGGGPSGDLGLARGAADQRLAPSWCSSSRRCADRSPGPIRPACARRAACCRRRCGCDRRHGGWRHSRHWRTARRRRPAPAATPRTCRARSRRSARVLR